MLTKALEQLNPGYFSTVMATEIISLALLLNEYDTLSQIFFGLGIGLYVVFIVLYLLRAICFPKQVWGDLRNASRVFGYFTFIAGTNVLGTRLAYSNQYRIALVLGIVGVVCWIIFVYFVLVILLFYNQQPSNKVLSGTWLLTTVSAESIASLSSALASFLPQYHSSLLFLSYTTWSIGIVLYLILIALILNQFFFSHVSPSDLSPPYWINMGAVAITTLAGSRLIVYPLSTHFVIFVQPFVQGFTMMLWAWGTWWIPFLVLIGGWKYLVFKQPIVYEPGLWSAVFPLGMYTVATYTLSHVLGLHILRAIVPFCLWISTVAWVFVCALFAIHCVRTIRHS
ncbi:tellurite resistance/C4-dicarboxylate transporter family protein [Alicyclobacillus fastidiosus]|uniref:Tellurite resistance/C4-dicarboxylate transporter family protein n=1 Tax=Alicyclobacillus fastidiosus TaxID=392011 RepID=A0ABV5AKG1_9BACL|nr:tellurite resistance/C4-dicarboxylate transporter family protein [Alicyclobacillus fastidiosus]WEH08455.1 tellurite resistance/C4-dicarboxylate transporter family protein [Alicyclobacillus fastidiosus]